MAEITQEPKNIGNNVSSTSIAARINGFYSEAKSAIIRNYKLYAILAIIYSIITILMFSQISGNIGKLVPGIGGDTYQNLWDIWWVGYATFDIHKSIWETDLLFWPIGADLVYQTMMPIGGIISFPLQLISIPFAYDILFLAGFPLAGLTTFHLSKYITHNTYASFFGGLVFAFSAVHIAQAYAHIDWIFIGWIPLAVYFYLKMINGTGSILNSLGLGISFVLISFMGDLEQSIMVVLLFLLILAGYICYKNSRKNILRKSFAIQLVAAVVFALVIGSFGYVPVLSTISSKGALQSINYLNNIASNELWSDNLASFFLPSYYNGIFHSASLGYSYIYKQDPTESVSYIGYSVILLAGYAIYKKRRGVLMWVAIAVIFGWMATGPYLQVGPNLTKIPGIYMLYHYIPIINVVREPGRFDVIFELAAAVLAAIGLDLAMSKYLQGNKKFRNTTIAIAAISIIFLIGNNGAPLSASLLHITSSSSSVPRIYSLLAKVPGNFSIMQLPALPDPNSNLSALYTGEATYYASVARKPLVGGYVTRYNNSQEISVYNIPLAVQAESLETNGQFSYLTPVLENYTNETLLTLYNYNTSFITINRAAFNVSSETALYTYMASVFGNPVYLSNTTIAFSTANAINSSIFRSTVSYPLFEQWSPASISNGTIVWRIVPTSAVELPYGGVVVYPGYPKNVSVAHAIESAKIYQQNVSISFTAAAARSSGFGVYVFTITPQSNQPKQIANISLTDAFKTYSVNTTMASGPIGNELIFQPYGSGYTSYSYIEFKSIRIS
ncbi:MAG: hypothetical protein QXN59_02960 [Candidatus Micrarchaeaceae archaeon]